jgi:MATE family multidrug resistance protein
VVALALPMFVNSSVQVLLNLTDTWFVAHISTEATAAIGAIYFLVLVFLLAAGGIGMGLQTLVAQAYGAGDRQRAARVTWAAAWLTLATVPLFAWLGSHGHAIIAPFGLAPGIEREAIAFWGPRLHGGSLAVGLYVMTSFFNGIGRPRVTLAIMAVTALVNALLNVLFIRHFGMGVAGSALATTCAQGGGVLLGALAFLGPGMAREFHSRRQWRPSLVDLQQILSVGVPTGLFPAVDVVGFALFQVMMARLGAVEGAATQLVMMLTSVAYLPGVGIGLAGTTLVGQSIGAGDHAWAMKLGTRVIWLGALWMGGLGILLALFGSWMLGLFVDPAGAEALATLTLATRLLWVAAAYQLFDAINLVSAFCLRGAGDVRLPTVFLLLASWLVFMPLTHALTFAPGQGYVDFLPQFGWGAVGGWIAALVYILLLAAILFTRWRSGAWKSISL